MTENNNMTKTWRDVEINPDMPLMALVQFLNVLNQRLATVEDLVTITSEDGNSTISLTEAYRAQAAAEAANANKPSDEE